MSCTGVKTSRKKNQGVFVLPQYFSLFFPKWFLFIWQCFVSGDNLLFIWKVYIFLNWIFVVLSIFLLMLVVVIIYLYLFSIFFVCIFACFCRVGCANHTIGVFFLFNDYKKKLCRCRIISIEFHKAFILVKKYAFS